MRLKPLPFLLIFLAAPAAASIPPPLVWLYGQWHMAEQGGRWAEEVWSPVRGEGQMLGVAHTGKGNRTEGFEFMRIRRDGETWVYHASPNGQPTVAFRQTGGSQDCIRLPCQIVFENKENDYPKRIEYRVDRVDELTAIISGADPAKDRMSWTYRKVWSLSPPVRRGR